MIEIHKFETELEAIFNHLSQRIFWKIGDVHKALKENLRELAIKFDCLPKTKGGEEYKIANLGRIDVCWISRKTWKHAIFIELDSGSKNRHSVEKLLQVREDSQKENRDIDTIWIPYGTNQKFAKDRFTYEKLNDKIYLCHSPKIMVHKPTYKKPIVFYDNTHYKAYTEQYLKNYPEHVL
jgi:hypothetical protein